MSKAIVTALSVVRVGGAILCICVLFTSFVFAQSAPVSGDDLGSRNVTVRSNTIGPNQRMGNLVFDQNPDRPFLYVVSGEPSSWAVYDVSDPNAPGLMNTSRLPGFDRGARATDITYFEADDHTFVIVGSSESSSAAVILDVSEVAPGQSVNQVAALSAPGGLNNLFAYHHSSGQRILFATGGGELYLYDLAAAITGLTEPISTMTIPAEVANVDYGFHSAYAAYHPETETDRLYTGAAGGYFVYDITDVSNASLLASINSAAVQIGHTIIPSPDGKLAVTTTAYPTAPIRIFDLQPALDGTIPRVRTAVGAWVADWKNFAEHFAVRWPFVFVASMQDGFQAFNMMFPVDPYTVGYYKTSQAPQSVGSSTNPEPTGAWDIDVRNSDGLIAVTDLESGLWLFQMEGFEAWDGRGWGLPNVSNAQDWENGPANASDWPPMNEE